MVVYVALTNPPHDADEYHLCQTERPKELCISYMLRRQLSAHSDDYECDFMCWKNMHEAVSLRSSGQNEHRRT